ncbi:MAG: hypothetical protein J0H22_16375 [Actinobacteria bacterium]|nr:hypothetical protein [Actinomycetota bacterium]
MDKSPWWRRHRTRRWLIAAAVFCAAALVAAAVVTRGFGLTGTEHDSTQSAAQDRCGSEVLKRLVSATDAKLSNIATAASGLDPDGRDLFPLMQDDPLKGVDRTRITVLNVTGTVNVPNADGSPMHDPFVCRAYFVDGHLADTLVLFDHKD